MEFHRETVLWLSRTDTYEELNLYCQLLPREGRIIDELPFGPDVIREVVNKAQDASQLVEQECSRSFPCALELCLRVSVLRQGIFFKHFLSEKEKESE